MQDIVLNWSSGKDAALALYHLLQTGDYRVRSLLTSLSEAYGRISMHGVREEVLERQAKHMQLPLQKIYLPEDADMDTYNRIMGDTVAAIKQAGIDTMGFGDIFLEDLRAYREQQLATAGMKALFPLWKKNTAGLVKEVEDCGIKALIVCVNDRYLDQSFLGRFIGRDLLADLPDHVDPCGEYGEYHSLVIDAPYFSAPLPVTPGETVFREYRVNEDSRQGFYFLDVLLKDEAS
ncbi:adenine nucleotide alpha hydrolase [Taibaiella koreensis]|uniref:adenine nucleotide alpha hydrolase n=1 Tax=Taibaiella koreensis TaxID=1268548 RepID=UPI000E5A0C95|nr:adenine nucleotide alpha hydrolase [Taibaiella koreensis]